MKTIALANQKGGVGKTTTAASLAIGLSRQGKKVLLVDADAQGNLTQMLGWPQPDELSPTLANLMGKIITDQPVSANEGILHHESGVDLLPANIELSALEVTLVNAMSRETVMRQLLSTVQDRYDYALIDCMSVPALAVDADTITENAGETLPLLVPAPAAVYPAEVRVSEENGIAHLEKVYYLTTKDDPTAIPTADFEREGKTYTLLDLLKNDLTETDTKEYIEVLTLDSKTKDLEEIIKTLEPELEVVTEDGYSGTLKPNYPSIAVEAAGYKNSSWTVSAKRTYPNLNDADISLIPKTIEDSGRTLTLADVDWQEVPTGNMGDFVEAFRYTANATYTGTAYSKTATGYTVTVEYGGEVTKTSCDTIVYTAVFTATGATPSAENADAQNTAEDFNYALLLIPLGILALGGVGYGGYKGYKHYQNKKRGYE